MKTYSIVATLLAAIVLTGCSLPAESRPIAAFPDLPLSAPRPTLTPVSTSIVAGYLANPKVTAYDPLDSMRNWNFSNETGALTDGIFELNGSAGWHSSFWPKQQFQEGQGLIMRFMLDKANARSEFVFVTGDWKTDSFRQFGIYNAVTPKGDLFQDGLVLGGYDLAGNLKMQSNTWYELLLAIGRNGHFLAVIWNPQDAVQRVHYDVVGGPNWAGKSWVFLPKASSGETVFVDDFYRITFEDIK